MAGLGEWYLKRSDCIVCLTRLHRIFGTASLKLILSNHSQGFSSLQQNTSLRSGGLQSRHAEDVVSKAIELPVVARVGLLYRNYLLFDSLHFLILKYEVYTEGAEQKELARCGVNGDAFPLILCFLPKSVATVLEIVHLRIVAPCFVELDEDGVSVPALQLPEQRITAAFQNLLFVFKKLSWAGKRSCERKCHKGSTPYSSARRN